MGGGRGSFEQVGILGGYEGGGGIARIVDVMRVGWWDGRDGRTVGMLGQ